MERIVKSWNVVYRHPFTGELVQGIVYAENKKMAIEATRKNNIPTCGESFYFEIVSVEEWEEKFTIHYNRRGESGNIFYILRAIYEECKRKGIAPTVFKEMQERVFASDSYDEALAIIGEKVNLIDDAKGRYTMNHKQWIVFSDSDGNELLKMTVKGSFEDEINSTINLLAYENNIDPAEISFAFVTT